MDLEKFLAENDGNYPETPLELAEIKAKQVRCFHKAVHPIEVNSPVFKDGDLIRYDITARGECCLDCGKDFDMVLTQ